jgi:hypothetical protein
MKEAIKAFFDIHWNLLVNYKRCHIVTMWGKLPRNEVRMAGKSKVRHMGNNWYITQPR